MKYEDFFELLIKNPEAVTVFLQPLVEKYLPVLDVVMDVLLSAGTTLQQKYAASDYPLASAKACKAKHDAFVEAGFTEEQAMSLLLMDIRQTAAMAGKVLNKTQVQPQ